MRIQDLYGVGNTEAGQAAATQAGKTQQAEAAAKSERSAAAPAGVAESDRVQLSDLTDQLSGLLGVEHPERAVRLERLAAEVQSGRYAVDALAVSRRLIEETLRGG